jgi:hypothetical protein
MCFINATLKNCTEICQRLLNHRTLYHCADPQTGSKRDRYTNARSYDRPNPAVGG